MWWYVCAYTDVQDLVPGTQLFLILKKKVLLRNTHRIIDRSRYKGMQNTGWNVSKPCKMIHEY